MPLLPLAQLVLTEYTLKNKKTLFFLFTMVGLHLRSSDEVNYDSDWSLVLINSLLKLNHENKNNAIKPISNRNKNNFGSLYIGFLGRLVMRE